TPQRLLTLTPTPCTPAAQEILAPAFSVRVKIGSSSEDAAMQMRSFGLALFAATFSYAGAPAQSPDLDGLLRRLRSEESLERRAAMQTLAAQPKLPARAAPHLVWALKDWRLRHRAASTLVKMGPDSIPSLLRFLETNYALSPVLEESARTAIE